MKKLLLICFVLINSCYFGEIEVIPEATKLLLRNQSPVELIYVSWNSIDFGDIDSGDKSEKIVSDGGTAYIYFYANDGTRCHTQALIPISKHKRKEITFISTTRIVCLDDPLNSLQLGNINKR